MHDSGPDEFATGSHAEVKEWLIDPAVESAIVSRRSVRAFSDRAVPRALVRRILQVASRAPSMTNTQPWTVRVLTGATLAAVTTALTDAHDRGEQGTAEYDYYPEQWTSPYLDRRRQVGWELYGLLGIARGEREAVARQHGRNYRFFDAPVGIIVTMDRALRTGSYLDLGMFMQNIMIAARGAGLDTCPQAAFAFMHKPLRDKLSIPPAEIVVCGMALGFADPDAVVNRLETVRVDVDSFATFHD